MPDDPDAVPGARGPEVPWSVGALELGAPPGGVMDVALRDGDLVERLALAEGDLAKGAAEVAVEGEDDELVDDQAAVGRDLDGDVGGR